ncbi:MAG: hypothetical protein CL492_14235 [Acinetobacter sp.]|nr:hypothetical protein [Acinetobacter sp.]
MKNLIDLLNKKKNYTYFIAEIGLNHNGSIKIAKDLISEAVKAGADAVKFQKRDVANLATNEILDTIDTRFPEFGSTYREIREFIEFNENEYVELKKFAKDSGIDFLCTAFDIESYNFLMKIGVDYLKIASHSVTNLPLIEHVAKNRTSAIVSTGMSELEDIDLVYQLFLKYQTDLVLLHCVSSYPTPPHEMNLNIISTLKNRYKNIPIGYSGHETDRLSTIAAVCKGARVVERHITLDKSMIGFDHSLSVTPNELKSLIHEIRQIEILMGTDEKKVLDSELLKKNQYNVSMISKKDILAGSVLNEDNVVFKNPGNGILYKDAHKYFGKTLKSSIKKDQVIFPKMFQKK